MKADAIEELMQTLELPVQFLTGATVKAMLRSMGNELPCTTEGDLIKDREMYAVSTYGILLVE